VHHSTWLFVPTGNVGHSDRHENLKSYLFDSIALWLVGCDASRVGRQQSFRRNLTLVIKDVSGLGGQVV
jgi:hypothetical protein